MKCIINAGNCIHNSAGQCQDKPKPEYIPCFGTVCFNIVTRKEVERIGMEPSRLSTNRSNLRHSKTAQDTQVLEIG
ncbi:hypothetical protein SOV_04440 [Sporomusa ovata DSM 2662]|uniref:Uncharacterized protein n=1 Tax=Sporomusa ovata TaxID=2378 RepID=A0A0U1KW99_9FIRM|nr:hypothetical protein [Sporomusa ovata]EQB28114.1 hypothetical protein SOV_2c10370 [Sporomusa ovata DSM 2662]CQR71651.1 hypothetical protein SpAn4DRAFT_3517 [Sporomusa ovata]